MTAASRPDDLAMLRAAKTYAERFGWHVFPLHEVLPGGACSCKRGLECGNAGKHPRTEQGFKQATTDVDQITRWWRRWPHAPIGIACGPSRLVVVDIDPRNQGDESLAQLERVNGKLPITPTQLTGGGGQHYVFRAPEHEVRSGTLALGIDLKAAGGYIVAAPSLHVSGRCYTWDAGAHPTETELADPPEWVIRSAKHVGGKRGGSPASSVTDGFLGAAFEAAGWLGRGLGPDKAAVRCPWEDEHTSGTRYDSSTVVFAPGAGNRTGWFHCSHSHCAGRKLADVLAELPEEAKQSAREKLKLPAEFHPDHDVVVPEPVAPPPVEPGVQDERPEWQRSLRFSGRGNLTTDVGNVTLLLANGPEWHGAIGHNAFSDRITWRRPLPPVPGLGAPQPGEELADHHWVYVHHWLTRFRGVSFSKQAILDGLEAAARANTSHPLREYLQSIVWDGTRRVPAWLHTYLGAEQSEYSSLVGRWWMISAVARAFRAGCQADHLLVLEGPQGSGKSTAVRILGGEWCLGNLPNLRERDEAAARLQGNWIVEIGELDALRGGASTLVKDFLSQTEDVYRKKYGRLDQRRGRQCVFIGTTNDARYLQDPTGARRFWPVACGALDRAGLQRDRDQLWAEAVHYYEAGEDWWPTDEASAIISERQEERYDVDEWEAAIGAWVGSREGFTVSEVLSGCLNLEPAKWDRAHQTRVGMTLRRLGFVSRQERRNGVVVRTYSRPSHYKVNNL